MRKFTCDFETTTDPDDCRVWAYALCEIGHPNNFLYGNDIYDLMDWCFSQKDNIRLYFHNLKFDGEFIVNWLLEADFKFIADRKEADTWTFTTLITDIGQWYSIEIWFEVDGTKRRKLTIYDSLKLLNFSVDEIAKAFDLPIRKLTLDYETKREEGHELTQHEIDYIRNDVEIMARALDLFFRENKPKMTIASSALASYKETNPNFRNDFPELPIEVDADIRMSYKGGFTYLNPAYKNQLYERRGVTLDFNSLYPSILYNSELPYSIPEPFEGKYEEDPVYPLYTQMLTCRFKIKPGKIPSIQIKHSFGFMPTEYLESSGGEIVTLVLTKPDLELFLAQYDTEDLEYISGWKFKSAKGLFKTYIDYWTNKKIQAKKDGSKPLYLTAKLYLNSLYGKFGSNPRGCKQKPILTDDGVEYEFLPEEIRKPGYVALAAFTTAYGRKMTIEKSQAIRDWSIKNKGFDAYIYSDTDSIHAFLDDDDLDQLKDLIDIDDYRLGAIKKESVFCAGKWLRQKCYVEKLEDGTMNVTVAGLPKKLSHVINFDNFKPGFTTANLTDEEIGDGGRKLTYKHVKGGVILVDTDFTII